MDGIVGTMEEQDGIRLTEAQKKRQRARSVAIALSLAVLVFLFYVVTIAKLGQNVITQPM